MPVQDLTKMQKAKGQMLVKHVFFATLLLSTEVKPVPGCKTAFTDMTMIGYDPDFIESLDAEVILFVLAHEVLHIVLKHGLRMGHREIERWNIACDHVVNLMLQKNGFKIWANCYCDPTYLGMVAEQVYELLEDKKGGGGGGSGGGKGKPGQGGPNPLEGDLRAPPEMDGEERAVMERRIDQNVAQAASLARMAGKLGADLERLVDGILNPPLPWQMLLREFMTQTTPEDENWNRRNRRFPTVYLPARWSERMGEICLIGDTSGSIGNDVFAQILSELTEIAEQVKPEKMRMVWCDARVAGEQVFEPGDMLDLKPKGGGGTDMRVALKHVEQYDPTVVVLITDGYTPWPDVEPDYPLIVCMTTNAACPVGRVVRIMG